MFVDHRLGDMADQLDCILDLCMLVSNCSSITIRLLDRPATPSLAHRREHCVAGRALSRLGYVTVRRIKIKTLMPALADDILSSIDQPLKLRQDSKAAKSYLVCDYNRDGDSYR